MWPVKKSFFYSLFIYHVFPDIRAQISALKLHSSSGRYISAKKNNRKHIRGLVLTSAA